MEQGLCNPARHVLLHQMGGVYEVPAQGEISLVRCPNLVLVKNTPKGRGVFASAKIPARTVVEVSPVLLFNSKDDEDHIQQTILYHYTYNWPVPGKPMQQAVVLGLGSLFNHSQRGQNVGWERDVDGLVVRYITFREIHPGEELCISYGSQLTFDDVEAPQQSPESESFVDKIDPAISADLN